MLIWGNFVFGKISHFLSTILFLLVHTSIQYLLWRINVIWKAYDALPHRQALRTHSRWRAKSFLSMVYVLLIWVYIPPRRGKQFGIQSKTPLLLYFSIFTFIKAWYTSCFGYQFVMFILFAGNRAWWLKKRD